MQNPFANLGKQLGLPETEKAAEPPGTAALAHLGAGAPEASTSVARAIVRMERAGRGGKEVTVVEQLGLPSSDLESWLKALKAALGCGGSIEGNSLMLQGDHRKRLPDVLKARGVRKVIVG